MPKDFNEYKRNRTIKESYEQASKIQEALALAVIRPREGREEYHGHLAVNDVLNKIDAMVGMFENAIQGSEFQESSGKIIEIICNLYDLAQIKLAEAKKQAKTYMEKASGTRIPDVAGPEGMPEDIPDEPDSVEQPGNDERGITFKTRGPMQPPEEELEPDSAVPPEPTGQDF